jgi:hypothetical protein
MESFQVSGHVSDPESCMHSWSWEAGEGLVLQDASALETMATAHVDPDLAARGEDRTKMDLFLRVTDCAGFESQDFVEVRIHSLEDFPGGNNRPICRGAQFNAELGTPLVIDFTDENFPICADADHTDEELTYGIVGDPLLGDAEVSEDGKTITYFPREPGYDTFQIRAYDPEGEDSPRTVLAVTVQEPDYVCVGDLDARMLHRVRPGWISLFTILVVDQEGVPVSGAQVDFLLDGEHYRRFTGPDGTLELRRVLPSAQETLLRVVDIGAPDGSPYRTEKNHDPEADSDGTEISLTR